MRTLGAMLALAMPLAASAATWHVPGDFYTIGVAIAEALPGDRIEVGPGVWTGPLLIEKDLEIVGTAGSSATKIKVLESEDPSVSISGAIVLLEGFRIVHDIGRPVQIDGATVDLVDIAISEQTSADSGAAIHVVNGSDVLVEGSTFDTNTSGLHGGHIHSEDSSLTVRNSTFTSGTATEDGGAIHAVGGTVDLASCAFEGNQSLAESGGAVHLEGGGSLSVSGGAFTGNTAAKYGGAIAVIQSTASIEGAWFTANEALGGGAIALDAGETNRLDVNTSALLGNSATSGGALWASGVDGIVGLTANVLDANEAESGGGLYAKTLGEMTAVGNLFCSNAATLEHGGAAYLEDVGTPGDHEWTNNLFVENTAIEDGGALYVEGQKVGLRNNHLLANQAGGNGGAVHFYAPAYTFLNNLVASTQAGDGVYASSAVALLYNDWFDNSSEHVSGELGLEDLGAGTLFDDPLLVAYSSDGNCGNDDYRPAPGSPLVDAGSPAHPDPDGSNGDIGAFGGPDSNPGLLDGDGDGVPFVYDCNDQDAGISPIAPEVCDPDDVDEDCDGLADDQDPEGAQDALPWYGDGDCDGFGDPADPRGITCDGAAEAVANALDCDDGDGTIHPDADEVCDPDDTDEDCDGFADDEDPEDALGGTLRYPDGDGDGYGDANDAGVTACDALPDTVDNALDCNDGDQAINPEGEEVCDPNDDDEDCDGLADDADPTATGQVDWYVDADGDGYGDDAIVAVSACDGGAAMVQIAGDCDDGDGAIHPGADEVCDPDDIDEDCDGVVDDADSDVTGTVTLCPDADEDGFGDASAVPVTACPTEGWVTDCTDCDDSLHGVNPQQAEIWYDGLDQDCDGNDDDRDLDTYAADIVGGPDCDDLDATEHPGADDVPGDGVDQDCDGGDARVRFGNGVSDDCGCGTGSAPMGWLWVPLLTIALRRRTVGKPRSEWGGRC
jgi:hypothetical protein